MPSAIVDRLTALGPTHNRLIILLVVVLTGVMVVGMSNLDTGSQAGGTTDAFPDTPVSEATTYVEERYGSDGSSRPAASMVYVRASGDTALSKGALLEALRYQRAVQDAPAAESLAGVSAVPNLVATRAAGSSSASLDRQIAALESTAPATVKSLVGEVLGANSAALALLPEDYTSGSASAESHRMVFRFDAGSEAGVPSDAQRVLYEAAAEVDGLEVFTLGEHARAENSRVMTKNTMELVVPIALLLILAVLAFAYRDLVDVVVGMVGVAVSIVWMFGILGLLGVGAGMTMLIGPVLIAGLSIDFGFHVFTRYREQRTPDEGLRPPMRRAMRGVAVALALVTVTAAIGFLSNMVNPVGSIRQLGVGITLGVVAAFLLFMTLVPALKVSIDGLLERVGLDRRKRPLGDGAVLRPVLSGAVGLARRAGPLVLVVALVASAGGAVAWTALDEESFQQQTEPAAEWKQDLPDPLGWQTPAYQEHRQFVRGAFSPVATGGGERFQLLVRGDVTRDSVLERVGSVTARPVFTGSGGRAAVVSPVTVLESVAADHPSVAAAIDRADTDGNGIPDRNLATVYEALYEAAPDRADRVLERSDGTYHSLRVIGPAETAGPTDDRAGAVAAAAAAIEAGDTEVSATAVSRANVLASQLQVMTDGIVRVLVVALGAVFAGLVLVYRWAHGSATLGALTATPILMVVALVVGGMYVLNVPLTLVTALLMSLVVGLGIDYNIHVSDRFLQELDRDRAPMAALETAVTGTGGALLGSTLTSASAFAALLIHPHPQMQSFGILVILTLATSFLVSVVVLPSALTIWVRHRRGESAVAGATDAPPPHASDD